jgi:hypothetical protein
MMMISQIGRFGDILNRNNRSAEMIQPTNSVTTPPHKNGATFFATKKFLVDPN